ncbi:MAG: tRNA preQ1(34) S-adenosylmethionine ribosyltransferase-isomerase QueA [Myxococcota bacterium]|jgi:S-adenosylmethionine:tRNA ribosyltransferase-isomerase|nr:tRNA preQ1(34) S-adenosylmethionine ribosyltransferase-isomerase QueA [Myxococcota bacterium]
MEADDYSFTFDPGQIAQHPLAARDQSRLLVLERTSGQHRHLHFADLPELVGGDELFVVNDTAVIPARLHGRRPTGGRVELLLVEPATTAAGCWRALGHAAKPLRAGQRLLFGEQEVVVEEPPTDGLVTVRFPPALDVLGFLQQAGSLPLPPYIDRAATPEDAQRYQTIFARQPGAVAAPTAGLHFTPALRARLEERGVRFASLTLHVGPGTFRPIVSERLADHPMHQESYVVPQASAELIRQAHREGRPVVAVGTTVVRTLEAAALAAGPTEELLAAGPGSTSLFIRPGHRFRVVSSLITNFHWPRSTLLVLVATLAGRERILAAYHEAVALGYRLFSYGDSMWIR